MQIISRSKVHEVKTRASFGERKPGQFSTGYLGNPNPSGSSLELLLPFFAIARMLSGRRRVRIIAWRQLRLHLSGTTPPAADDDDDESLTDATTRMVLSRRRRRVPLCPPPPPLRRLLLCPVGRRVYAVRKVVPKLPSLYLLCLGLQSVFETLNIRVGLLEKKGDKNTHKNAARNNHHHHPTRHQHRPTLERVVETTTFRRLCQKRRRRRLARGGRFWCSWRTRRRER